MGESYERPLPKSTGEPLEVSVNRYRIGMDMCVNACLYQWFRLKYFGVWYSTIVPKQLYILQYYYGGDYRLCTQWVRLVQMKHPLE